MVLGADENESLIKQERLIDWVVERFADYMRKILLQRPQSHRGKDVTEDFVFEKVGSNMDEVVEVIALPKFDGRTTAETGKHETIEIDSVVLLSWWCLLSLINSNSQGRQHFINNSKTPQNEIFPCTFPHRFLWKWKQL